MEGQKPSVLRTRRDVTGPVPTAAVPQKPAREGTHRRRTMPEEPHRFGAAIEYEGKVPNCDELASKAGDH